jgi:hypothetical protein
MFGFDMPSALLCPARYCTPDVVGGVVFLPSMSYLVKYHHHHHGYTKLRFRWCEGCPDNFTQAISLRLVGRNDQGCLACIEEFAMQCQPFYTATGEDPPSFAVA